MGDATRNKKRFVSPSPTPPHTVNDLYGRTFAVWTAVTCALCLACARDPRVAPVYGATLFSFVVALAFFAGEAFIFRTMSPKSAAQPGIIATVSAVWMAAGWSYYVRPSGGGPTATVGTVGPAASEEIEESVSKFD